MSGFTSYLRNFSSADMRTWKLRVDWIVFSALVMMFMVWGFIINVGQGTLSLTYPSTFSFVYSSSLILGPSTNLSTHRNIQPITIAGYSEEPYLNYQVMTYVGAFVLSFGIWLGKTIYAMQTDDKAYSKYKIASQSMGVGDNLKAEGGSFLSDEVAFTGDKVNVSGDSALDYFNFIAAFFPTPFATGLMYIIPVSIWLPSMMYQLGLIHIGEKYFFVEAAGNMGASLIIIETVTLAVLGGKSSSSPTNKGLLWGLWFVGLIQSIRVMITLGNIISNQETAWNNQVTNGDASYITQTVYQLGTSDRNLRIMNPNQYETLQFIRAVQYIFNVVQGIRIVRAFVLLMVANTPAAPGSRRDKLDRMCRVDWAPVLVAMYLVSEIAIYGELIHLGVAICKADQNFVAGMRLVVTGRTEQ